MQMSSAASSPLLSLSFRILINFVVFFLFSCSLLLRFSLMLITSPFSFLCYTHFVQNQVPDFTPYGFALVYNFVNITNYQQYQG